MSDGLNDTWKMSKEGSNLSFGMMSVHGYASIKYAQFDWGKEGLNIIQAPNGFGKTQFINAFVWCLYGKPLKGSVSTWEHVQSKDYKGTMVSVDLIVYGDDISVTRCKDYKGKIDGATGKNRLIIKKNGNDIKGVREKRDYQNFLDNTLGYSFDLFKNSIVFGQKLKRLINETGPNKKRVLDEAFEVEYIPKARKIVDDEKKKALKEYDLQKNKVEKLSSKLESLNTQLESEKKIESDYDKIIGENVKAQELVLSDLNIELRAIKKRLKTFDNGTKKQIAYKELEIVNLDKSIRDMNPPTIRDKEKHWDYQLQRANDKVEEYDAEITLLEESIKNIPTSCPQCHKKFTPSEKRKEKDRLNILLKKSNNNHQEQLVFISECKGYLAEIDKQLSSITSKEESISTIEEELEILESNLKNYKENQRIKDKIVKDITNTKSSIDDIRSKKLKTRVSEVSDSIEKTTKLYLIEKKSLRKFHRDYKIKEWLMNDPLSNAGLKAFIFDQMLDNINDRLGYYSRFIGFQVVFDIDMDSVNKDLNTYVYIDDNPIPYSDLSGGQQQSVDVATAFSIHDVINKDRECNLLVMDEVFESLDKHNIEIVGELIQDKVHGKCLYLITHRSEFSPVNANILKVGYIDGVTSLV